MQRRQPHLGLGSATTHIPFQRPLNLAVPDSAEFPQVLWPTETVAYFRLFLSSPHPHPTVIGVQRNLSLKAVNRAAMISSPSVSPIVIRPSSSQWSLSGQVWP